MPDVYAAARALIANRLAIATQSGDARKADAYADCFTPAGVLQLDGQVLSGREAIRQWMRAPSVIPAPAASTATPAYVSHHLTTMRIDLLDEATATARTYWFVITAHGPDHSGYYDDRLEQLAGDWLIAHRRPRTLWYSPQSLVRPA
ncbi:MAG: nuclear transport factor 2 family protein [Sphingomonadales bacterium]|nr:nuclear transport factor 2 family protein [Sphingomonadales bacterium]